MARSKTQNSTLSVLLPVIICSRHQIASDEKKKNPFHFLEKLLLQNPVGALNRRPRELFLSGGHLGWDTPPELHLNSEELNITLFL